MTVSVASDPDRIDPPRKPALARYRTLWAWMIVPMVFMQAGIFFD